MPRSKYHHARTQALVMQREICSQLAQLYSRKSLLSSGWLADMVEGKVSRDAVEDYAIIDPIIRCYPELEGARVTVKQQRTEQKQRLFRKKLCAKYSSMPNRTSDVAYCQISHELVPTTTAAHIVNVNVGNKIAEVLFGHGQEHIWPEGNGLVIQKAYERLLDEAKAVVLPISNDPGETEFELVLLTHDLGRQGARLWDYEDLQHRRLHFQTSFRPAKRYLYFKAALSLLRRRRANVPGHEMDLEALTGVGRTMWASPKPYLKNSILYRFSRELGCLSQVEANRFWGIEHGIPLANLSLEERETVNRVTVLMTNAILDEEAEQNKEEETDDEEDEETEQEVDEPVDEDDLFV